MANGFRKLICGLAVGVILPPVSVAAQTVPTPPASVVDPQGDAPIVPDLEFEKAVPTLSDDLNAPLEPVEDFIAPAPPLPEAAELETPLPPLAQFDVTPVEITGVENEPASEIRYSTKVEGLEEVGLSSRFSALSALKADGDAPNAAVLSARAKEDEGLAIRLMTSLGYYDATATSVIEQVPNTPGRARAVLTALPGRRYSLASITVQAAPTVPPQLVETNLPLKIGDAIEAERIQGAEANVSITLPQQGYAFATVGERDILLDEAVGTGDYTLPVDVGPRGSFGAITAEGKQAFGVDHIEVLARFAGDELYDSRKVDDLRQALVATGLFSTVSVEPQRTGRPLADGTEAVDLLVRQEAGPARTLAATAGYGTGQGLRVEASWTHRNLFPPEGALIVNGVLGTQEQGLSTIFRRSNAGQRDRTFSLQASANRSNYDAFEAFTGILAARVSYDSTPIWQKRFTYGYGVELIGTNEDVYDFALADRVRRTYFIGALPLFAGFDTSDDLLNPTKGFRLKFNASPEVSMQDGTRPYGRFIVEATGYYPIGSSIVLAGRIRGGSIAGISRDELAPSRRFYAGGGGSVRGFGYQELGPRTTEPNPNFDPTDPEEEDSPVVFRPVGGRSVNEAAFEVRYRFGNFGIVPFFDIGQVYDSTLPKGSDLRFGAGIGGRFYTNFGPFRVDVATPINRREGESKIALYLSIGQAF